MNTSTKEPTTAIQDLAQVCQDLLERMDSLAGYTTDAEARETLRGAHRVGWQGLTDALLKLNGLPGELVVEAWVVSEGEAPWVGPWVEFVAINRDGIDAVELARILGEVTTGGIYRGGGGAACEFTVRRVTVAI